MRIGRRLALILLLTVTPVVALYTYWSVQWSRQGYIADLKRETRATMRGLAPVLAGYVRQQEWTQVHELFQRMSADGTRGALLKVNGEIWYATPDFPHSLIVMALQGGGVAHVPEFEQIAAHRYWFCRIVPLNPNKPIGYFLVAQDWTDIGENLRGRMLPPVGAAVLVVALIAGLIPLLVSRYVSKPLADLSRKVMHFSETELADSGAEDEMKLISEEFQRLDRQLTKAHAELLERHRYELELDRRLQRADRLATIGTLASGLAHEIGTPMGVIRTRTELLMQGSPTIEKVRESLAIVLNQIDRISRIVRMLLDYGRERESRRAINDVRTIVEHVLKLVESEARRHRIGIIAELGAQPLMAECDADQLQQVFVNLAVNAFDATPEGGMLKVSAAIAQRDHRADVIRVSFEDSGSGVPPEFREKLFDPFFTTKPPGKGTGMGLAVSQSIMRNHGGDLIYEAGATGARFSVTMPTMSAHIERPGKANSEGSKT